MNPLSLNRRSFLKESAAAGLTRALERTAAVTVMPRWLIVIPWLLLGPATVVGQKPLKPAEVPTFQLRARVTSIKGQQPAGKKFTFRFTAGGPAVSAKDGDWSGWLHFGKDQVEATLKSYPALYLGGYPVVVKLQTGGVVDPTVLEAELKFDGDAAVDKLSAELFGPALGILLWKQESKAKADTMAGYNRRYWKALGGVTVPAEQRPRKFPIIDRFIGGDDDRRDWREGIENLSHAGFSAIMLPPGSIQREMLLKVGLRRTAWGVYSPPGYAFDHDPKFTALAIPAWAKKQAQAYRDAGYASKDMAVFAMSDEPGWYYPGAFAALEKNPAVLTRFRDYLKAQGLTPAKVGAKSWDEVKSLGRSQAKDLPSRRLFYWTMRFYAWDSARHFASCTRALENEFYPGLPVLTNWNFFAGRLYVPGAVANNPDKQNPDAAMGGHDWFEFGRLRGGTMLWTEDWFPDSWAYQWSFYCSKLRCAAAKGKVQFGGYVIPRAAGDRTDGIVQKILCVVGSGGKAIKYFVFGPEYNFPGNCYSERAQVVLPKMAEAHRLIGAAEELLWPGERPRPQVAILAPRSAQLWDAAGTPLPRQIVDATNNNQNRATVDYFAEVCDLYLALQHANIPVDFVEEDDLSADGLKPYRVLYVTEPNVPESGQRGIADWVRAGGTLVTVSGAGTRDRYNDPCTVLARLSGIVEEPRERLLVASVNALQDVGKGSGKLGDFVAVGVRGKLKASKAEAVARFADGTPAILRQSVERGRVIHFPWMPGMSYWKSSTMTRDRLPVGFSKSLRGWIVWPTELAGVRMPVEVDHALVETPLLLSDKGAAVTVLNWTGEKFAALRLVARVPFPAREVGSVRHGRLPFKKEKDGIVVTLPLGAVDIITVRP